MMNVAQLFCVASFRTRSQNSHFLTPATAVEHLPIFKRGDRWVAMPAPVFCRLASPTHRRVCNGELHQNTVPTTVDVDIIASDIR